MHLPVRPPVWRDWRVPLVGQLYQPRSLLLELLPPLLLRPPHSLLPRLLIRLQLLLPPSSVPISIMLLRIDSTIAGLWHQVQRRPPWKAALPHGAAFL